MKKILNFVFKHSRIIVVALVVVVILVLLPFARGLSVEALLSYSPQNPLLAALLLIALYSVKAVVMAIPTYGLYIVGGILFPPGWAILIAYIGLAIEMCLGFLLGRWLGRDAVRSFAQRSPRVKKVIGYIDGNSQFVCFLTRVLPMPYPVDLGSMLFGASGMGFVQHLGFSLLGLSAVMIPITLAGGSLDNPLSARFIVPFVISITLCVGLMLAYRAWQKKQEKKAAAASGDEESGK